MKKALIVLAVVGAATAIASPGPAEARGGFWRGGFGPAVAGGGLIAGAVAGALASSAYAWGPGYYGAYGPGYYVPYAAPGYGAPAYYGYGAPGYYSYPSYDDLSKFGGQPQGIEPY
jgi:hypothetical protein